MLLSPGLEITSVSVVMPFKGVHASKTSLQAKQSVMKHARFWQGVENSCKIPLLSDTKGEFLRTCHPAAGLTFHTGRVFHFQVL